MLVCQLSIGLHEHELTRYFVLVGCQLVSGSRHVPGASAPQHENTSKAHLVQPAEVPQSHYPSTTLSTHLISGADLLSRRLHECYSASRCSAAFSSCTGKHGIKCLSARCILVKNTYHEVLQSRFALFEAVSFALPRDPSFVKWLQCK